MALVEHDGEGARPARPSKAWRLPCSHVDDEGFGTLTDGPCRGLLADMRSMRETVTPSVAGGAYVGSCTSRQFELTEGARAAIMYREW